MFHTLLPFCLVLGAILTSFLFDLCGAAGVIFYLPLAAVAAIALLTWAISGKGSRHISSFLALIVLCAASVVLCRKHEDISETLRWALWSKELKAAALSQPSRFHGELKHVAWDEWGSVIGGGTVYIVFDPSNALDEAAESNGFDIVLTPLPHAFSRVRRLEKSWYSVAFFTGLDWDD